jgi:UrcA family protein
VNVKSRKLRAALLAGTMILSFTAMAQEPADSVVLQSQTVRFDRMQAATPAGAQELYSSLQRAAVRVCLDPQAPAGLQRADYAECRDIALAKAVGDVGIDAVAALYQGGDGVPRGTVTVER